MSILALPILAFLMALLWCVAMIAVALGRRGAVLLLLRWVRRVAAVWVVALVIVAVALLRRWGLMRIRRRAIRARLLRIRTMATLPVLVVRGRLLTVLRRLRWIVVVALLLALLLALLAAAPVIIVATHRRYHRVFLEACV